MPISWIFLSGITCSCSVIFYLLPGFLLCGSVSFFAEINGYSLCRRSQGLQVPASGLFNYQQPAVTKTHTRTFHLRATSPYSLRCRAMDSWTQNNNFKIKGERFGCWTEEVGLNQRGHATQRWRNEDTALLWTSKTSSVTLQMRPIVIDSWHRCRPGRTGLSPGLFSTRISIHRGQKGSPRIIECQLLKNTPKGAFYPLNVALMTTAESTNTF